MVADRASLRQAWQNAVAAYERGDHDAAARALAPLKGLDALPAEVELLAGFVALQLDEPDEAEQRLTRAAAAFAGNADAWLALGDARFKLDRLDEAIDAYRQCLECAPGHVIAWRNLGFANQRMARDSEALECFEKVLELAPEASDVALTRARLLTRMGRGADAAAAYRALHRADPDDEELAVEYAEFLEQANRPDEAEGVLPDAGRLGDELGARATEVRARVLERAGRTEAALALLGRVGDGPPWDRLGYRQGALLDRLGRYDQAMQAFSIANRARSREPRFRDAGAATFASYLERKIAGGATAMARSAASDAGDPNPPAFLVGLPRSGTTLLGAMLGAHPNIRLLEEPETLRALESALGDGAAPGQARSAYWRQAIDASAGPAESLVLDKNPLHIPQLDSVARAFPDAKVVLLLRHPYDAALSCYMQDFAPNPATAHFLDLESTAWMGARLLDMVQCFEEALPGRVRRVHYEDLVAGAQPEVAGVLDALGLDWHPDVAAAIERRDGERLVRTPSHAQIVQSLYGGAVGRWMNYAEWLEDVRKHLGPRLASFGYSERMAGPDRGL